MNPVVHFEMPYEDGQRMADFYAKAFGWKPQILGPDMGNYIVVTTTELGENGFPKTPGQINGGLYKKSADHNKPSVVIAVDNIEEAMKKIADAGGTVVGGQTPGKPDDIPGVGLYISFIDTEGNKIAVLQPYPKMQTRPQ